MWRRTAAACAVAAALAAGCGSGATKGAEPPAIASPSASASPTQTATPTTTATPFISSADEAGAKAFVTAYYTELDKAFATGNVAALAPYRLPSCPCVGTERNIRKIYDAGGSISGAKLTILRWAFGDHGPAFARTGIYFHGAALVDHLPGQADVVERAIFGDYLIDLRRTSNRWVISDIRFKEAAAQ